MGKTFCFLSTILLMLMLSACGHDGGNGVSSEIRTAAVDSSVEQTAVLSEEEDESDKSQLEKKENIDLSSYFDGINGCAVIYSPENHQYDYYHENMCEQRTSPFSTFKIISALLGLENGVIQDENSTMNYNGSQYSNEEWNRNLTLQEAFQTSCIWYFRQVLDVVGETAVQETLEELSYGNCDISEWEGSAVNPVDELNGFWLDSSLEISPAEQIEVLSKIMEGNSAFHPSNIEILKNIMLVKNSGMTKIYGKTGSGGDGKAWFVGFSEENDERKYFAIYLSDPERAAEISGSTAKDIALKIFLP